MISLIIWSLSLQSGFAEMQLLYEALSSNQSSFEGWVVRKNYTNQIFTSCEDVQLFGGFETFGTNTFVLMNLQQIPPHFQLNFQFILYQIDTWDSESFKIQIDNHMESQRWDLLWGEGKCGQQNVQEIQRNIDITLLHDSPSVQIILTSNLDEAPDNESWGLLSLRIYYNPCTEGCIYCNEYQKSDCAFYSVISNEWYHGSLDSEGWGDGDLTLAFENCSIALDGVQNMTQSKMITRNFLHLPQHSLVQVNFKLWKIDSSIPAYEIYIQVDQEVKQIVAFIHFVNLCGEQTQDSSAQGKIFYLHHENQLQIVFGVTYQAIPIIWGIRELEVLLLSCDTICTNECNSDQIKDCTCRSNTLDCGCVQDLSLKQNEYCYFQKQQLEEEEEVQTEEGEVYEEVVEKDLEEKEGEEEEEEEVEEQDEDKQQEKENDEGVNKEEEIWQDKGEEAVNKQKLDQEPLKEESEQLQTEEQVGYGLDEFDLIDEVTESLEMPNNSASGINVNIKSELCSCKDRKQCIQLSQSECIGNKYYKFNFLRLQL